MIDLVRPERFQLIVMVLLWPGLLLALAAFTARQGRGSMTGGLSLLFVITLFMNHWPGGAVLLQEWYEYYPTPLTWAGFKVTTYGLLAFILGVILVLVFKGISNKSVLENEAPKATANLIRFSFMMLGVGVAVNFFIWPFVGNIPTISSIMQALSNLMVIGVCLLLIGYAKPTQRLIILASTMIFPLLTVLVNGFMGFGLVMLLTVFCFWLSLGRIRPIYFVIAPFALMLSAAVYVTYMTERTVIRESVWGGAPIGERGEVLSGAATRFEWFDPNNPLHLRTVDIRLNQNFLVGATIEHMQHGREPFANGETLLAAVVAIIPRAIWPDKPVVGGGGDVVARYSGLDFARGTSVGVGNVLELYINFGISGVMFGMLFLGLIVGELNSRVSVALRTGRYDRAMIWMLSGTAFTNPLGSFAELSTSFFAALAGGTILLIGAERYFGAGMFQNVAQSDRSPAPA